MDTRYRTIMDIEEKGSRKYKERGRTKKRKRTEKEGRKRKKNLARTGKYGGTLKRDKENFM